MHVEPFAFLELEDVLARGPARSLYGKIEIAGLREAEHLVVEVEGLRRHRE